MKASQLGVRKKSSLQMQQGLRERNQNIIKSHKKSEKDRVKSIVVPSHAANRSRVSPDKVEDETADSARLEKKSRLDDEEMLFLAKRCLAEELMTRPKAPSGITESTSALVGPQAGSSSPPDQTRAIVAPPVLATVPRVVARRNNAIFHLNRLGVGLVVLQFGWIWISCGGLVVADSVFCTTDIGILILRRLRDHLFKVGARVQYATRETVRLFTEDTTE